MKKLYILMLMMPLLTTNTSARDVVKDTLEGARILATSPSDIFNGKVAGVRVSSVDENIEGLKNVNIRGFNTLRGDSQPLWIVDGVVLGNSFNQNLDAFYSDGGLTINGDKLPDYSGRAYVSPLGNLSWLNPYEIESIEILNDLSSASLYGIRGANGVIIVETTRNKNQNVRLNSNVGVNMPGRKGPAFRPGIVTVHDLGMSGTMGANSFYGVSGFLRYDNGTVKNSDALTGSLNLKMETTASEVFAFGFNTDLSYRNLKPSSGTNHIGAPSLMAVSRYPYTLDKDNVEDWLDSYDDEVIDYHLLNSVWLKANLHKTLSLRVNGSIDYQNHSRYIWYGEGTSFGKEFSGAAGILNNSLFNYSAEAVLDYSQMFGIDHRVTAALAFVSGGSLNKHNSMCGTDFDMPYLRAKGMSSAASMSSIRRFSISYTTLGGYAAAGYDYKDWAGVKGCVRADYTLDFDKEPLWFPSVEAYLDFHKMFLPDNKAISALRLVGGYGKAGNEIAMPYEYVSRYINNVPEVEKGTEPFFDGLNRLLSEEWNVGVHMGFADERINLSLKYYDKRTDDLFRLYNRGKILSDKWVETSKWTICHERQSSISNNGFEVGADFLIVNGKNIRWSADLNAAYNINRVMNLDELDVCEYIVEGGRSTLPKVHGGLGTVLSLYGFDLDLRFSGAAGHYIVNANNLIKKHTATISEDDIERGDYLRLERVGLSYRIPLKSRLLKAMNVNLAAENLFTATSYSGWNPDVNSFGTQVRYNGLDYGSFPVCRTFVLGVNLKF